MGKSSIDPILSGERMVLARLLTGVENDSPAARHTLDELFPHTGKAHLVGVTGAPGTGKSSLVNQIALHYRRARGDKSQQGGDHCRGSYQPVHRRSGAR